MVGASRASTVGLFHQDLSKRPAKNGILVSGAHFGRRCRRHGCNTQKKDARMRWISLTLDPVFEIEGCTTVQPSVLEMALS